MLRISLDHSLVGAITKILIEIRARVQIRGGPVQLFAIWMETKETARQAHKFRLLETRNALGGTFIVSQTQKRLKSGFKIIS
jgi:hypothetical protein